MNDLQQAITLLPTCKALITLAQADAPNYQQASDQQEKCSLCEFYVRSTECDLYDFVADPDYVCSTFEPRTPDVGELRAFVEQYGARNSRPDLSMLQQVHDLTVKLGAVCGEGLKKNAFFVTQHLAGKHNQKTHANKYGSTKAAKESLRRLKDDKGAREKYKERARAKAKQGGGGQAKSKPVKERALEDMSREELLTLRGRIDGLLKESDEHNEALAVEKPEISHGHITTAYGTDPTKQYEMRYEVRELDDLVTSNTESGAINPDYPKELQPRDRSRAASQLQVDNIAQDIEPDAMIDEFKSIDRGTPIIGDDGVVESGNGRSMALRRAQDRYPDQYGKYKDRLRETAEEKGIDPASLDSFDNPVLVRVRQTDVDRAEFAKDANTASVLSMSATERARSDASRIRAENLHNLQQSGDNIDQTLRSAQNRDFVRSFVANTPEVERAEMVDKVGNLTLSGEKRIKAAMFNRVYDSPELSDRIFETTDNDMKNVTNGLMNSLGSMSRAEELVRTGQRATDLSIADDITKSVQIFGRLKGEKISVDDYLAQGQLFGRELNQAQEKILRELDGRRRSGKQVKEFLDGWGNLIEAEPHPSQTSFFGPSGRSKNELIDTWIAQSGQQPSAQGVLF